MWNRVTKLLGLGPKESASDGRQSPSLQATLKALDESAVEAPKPTLVCRQCGLKYENTGTFLKGSRCPACFPNG